MREKNKDLLDNSVLPNDEVAKFSDSLALDYCGFRLKSLANKIKSEYLKFKKNRYSFN